MTWFYASANNKLKTVAAKINQATNEVKIKREVILEIPSGGSCLVCGSCNNLPDVKPAQQAEFLTLLLRSLS